MYFFIEKSISGYLYMQIHNIFPLTVCFDTLKISENERKKLIDNIKNLHKKSEPKHNPHSAWTGDQGQDSPHCYIKASWTTAICHW